MYQVGETTGGNILVEMTPREWEAVSHLFRTSLGFTTGIGAELARYRKSQHLTQAEMAQTLNISKSYISRIERNAAGKVSPAILQRIMALVQND